MIRWQRDGRAVLDLMNNQSYIRRLMLSCLPWWLALGLLSSEGQENGPSIPSPEIESPDAVAVVTSETIAIDEVSAAEAPDASAPSVEGQGRRDRIEATKDVAGALELGWSFFEKQQWENARQWFGEAYRYDPSSKRAAEGMIMTEYRAGDVGEAYRVASTHADLVPEGTRIVAEAAAVAGRRLVDAGELEEAEKAISEIPKDEPAVSDVRRAIASSRIETAVAREDFGEARNIAEANDLPLAEVDREESIDLLQAASEARDRGEHRESLELVERAEELAPLDRSGERVKAWALYQNRDFQQAAGLFEDLYRVGRDRDSAEGLVNSLQQAGDLETLNGLSDEMGGPLAAVSEPVLLAATRAEDEKQRQAAAAMEEEAASREAMMAAVDPVEVIVEPPIEAEAPAPIEEAGSMGLVLAAATATRSTDLPLEINQRRPVPERPRVSFGGGYREREGDEGGIDRLKVESLPTIEATLVFGEGDNQAVTLGVHVMKLKTGKSSGRRLVGIADSTLDPGPFVTETDTLVEPALSYRLEKGRRAFFAEVGATPLGAEISAAPIGEIGIAWENERSAGSLQAFAESVEDSLLSYTGMTDPYTGKDWGRVVEAGVRLDGAMSLGRQWSGHGLFEFGHFEGEKVADNNAVVADIGLSYELEVPGFEYLAIGPTFHFEHYEKNLGEFTAGHGGYFSPDELYQGMLGLSFLTESGRRWLAEGFLGIGGQTHEVAAAPVLPQAPDGRFYDASSDSSAIFTARLQTLFEINPQWRFGAEAGYAKSAAYEDFAVNFYLSILFDPEWGLDRSDFVR